MTMHGKLVVLAAHTQKGGVPVSNARTDRKYVVCFKSDHLIADCEVYKQKQSASVPRKPKRMELIKIVYSGIFPLAVCPCFPISGADFILVNDIAREKV